MTVAVSCNLSEGVILGVDSAVSVMAPGGVSKIYENASKLFQLGNKPIGIATFGLGGIAGRTIGSYLHEYEHYHAPPENYTIESVVGQLRDFFMEQYRTNIVPQIEQDQGKSFDEIPPQSRPGFGLVVGGFSSDQYLSEVWSVYVPGASGSGETVQNRQQKQFGTNWFAQFEPVRRYVKGYDVSLMDALIQYFRSLVGRDFTQQELENLQGLLDRFEYPIPFDAMPIEEGLAHTRFLIDLVINHHRFAMGAPVVGGKARLGMVTYKAKRFVLLDRVQWGEGDDDEPDDA